MLVNIFVLLIFSSCSLLSSNKKVEMVTLDSARDMAKQSYIKGCQENFVEKKDKRYQTCINKSDTFIKKYFDEILNQ